MADPRTPPSQPENTAPIQPAPPAPAGSAPVEPAAAAQPSPGPQPAAWSPGPAAAPAATPPAGPSGPRRMWREATASPGATVATVVALALATLLVLGGLTAAAVAVARHGDGGMERARGPFSRQDDGSNGNGRGKGFGRHHRVPGNNGNGKGNGNGGGMPAMPDAPDQGVGPGNGAGGLGGLGSLGGAQHGEFTGGDGTAYLVQRGAVTASSATSVTVKSADGFSATYAVSGATVVAGRGGSPAVGAQVVVLANKEGRAAVQIRVAQAGTPAN